LPKRSPAGAGRASAPAATRARGNRHHLIGSLRDGATGAAGRGRGVDLLVTD
jgi:hypothetical protein